MGKTTQKLFLDVISYTILIAGAVIMVGPFLWMVATSFKLPADQFTHTFIPNPATLENFRNLFSFDMNFPRLFLISTGIALMVTDELPEPFSIGISSKTSIGLPSSCQFRELS